MSEEKAVAPHSSTLAWEIPWTQEPGGLQSMGSLRVRHDWTTERLNDFTFHFHALEKEMATQSSVLAWRIPGMAEPGGLPSMGSHSRTWLKWLSSSSSSIVSGSVWLMPWGYRIHSALSKVHRNIKEENVKANISKILHFTILSSTSIF